MTLLDICSYLGLGAVGAVGINMCWVSCLSLRYSPVRLWPCQHINLFVLHRWTAYAAIALTLSHPAVLLFLKTPHFSLFDVLWPIHSYLQPKLNLAGAGALYLIVLVVVTSLLRSRMAKAARLLVPDLNAKKDSPELSSMTVGQLWGHLSNANYA